MNRREAERLTRQRDVLVSLGFTSDEAESLRRISRTLHRWHELECGDGYQWVERDEVNGKPYRHDCETQNRWSIPDRERGALKRLARIMEERNARVAEMPKPDEFCAMLDTFIQTDPRGAALYILRPGDVPEGERADVYYTRGVCVY